MNWITVMVIDRQEFFRAGLCQALSQQPDIKVLDYNLGNGPLESIESSSPDVVLLGIDFPPHNGLELGRRIARCYPNTRVVMLSPSPNDDELFEVIKTGAVAYLDRNATVEELANVIRWASRGE